MCHGVSQRAPSSAPCCHDHARRWVASWSTLALAMSKPAHVPEQRTEPRRAQPPQAAAITPANYRSDPLFPRIEKAVLSILATAKVVAPVDVLVRIGAL